MMFLNTKQINCDSNLHSDAQAFCAGKNRIVAALLRRVCSILSRG